METQNRFKDLAAVHKEHQAAHQPVQPKPTGRPPADGKRFRPGYSQVSAYIPDDLHCFTKIYLLHEQRTTGVKKDFSDLIAELLERWNQEMEAKFPSTRQS